MYISPKNSKIVNNVQIQCEYPGQTMMVALAIMLNFDSFQDASSKGNTFPKASECLSVPGAGCAVRGALHVLKQGVSNDLDAQAMVEHCKAKWEEYAGHQDSYKDRIKPGNERAEPFVKEFMSRWEEWKQKSIVE